MTDVRLIGPEVVGYPARNSVRILNASAADSLDQRSIDLTISNASVIDLVVDCGADNTGATDTSAAWTAAFAILKALATNPLLPSKTLTLYVPPGAYLLTTPVQSTPTAATASRLVIQGCGDASVVLINVGSANIAVDLLNWTEIDVVDLSFQGVQTTTTPDCNFALRTSAVGRSRVIGCHFSYIYNNGGAQIWCNQGALLVEHTKIGGCGGAGTCYNILGTSCQLTVRDCFISDFPTINGSNPTNNKGGNQVQIGYVGYPGAMFWMGLEVTGCFVDESNAGSVKVSAGGGIQVPHVYLRDNQMLAPQAGADGVVISTVGLLEIDGHTVQAVSGSGGNAVNLQSVSTAKIRALLVDNAFNTNKLVTDAACGVVEIEQSPTLLTSKITSSAKVMKVRETSEGAWTSLYSSGASITSGQLVKQTATGIQPLGIADASSLLFGVAYDTVASSANVRVAGRGQRVTVLSDGATTIAVGDQITNSAATAGEVKKGTTSVIGIALTAATNVAGTAFDMQFL